MTKLNPCPFCGSRAVVVSLALHTLVPTTAIGCTNVHCGFTVQMDDKADRVVGMWNRLGTKDPEEEDLAIINAWLDSARFDKELTEKEQDTCWDMLAIVHRLQEKADAERNH